VSRLPYWKQRQLEREDAIARKQLDARTAKLRPAPSRCAVCGEPERDDIGPVAGTLNDKGVCFLCDTGAVRR
jgi:hypothetical protein